MTRNRLWDGQSAAAAETARHNRHCRATTATAAPPPPPSSSGAAADVYRPTDRLRPARPSNFPVQSSNSPVQSSNVPGPRPATQRHATPTACGWPLAAQLRSNGAWWSERAPAQRLVTGMWVWGASRELGTYRVRGEGLGSGSRIPGDRVTATRFKTWNWSSDITQHARLIALFFHLQSLKFATAIYQDREPQHHASHYGSASARRTGPPELHQFQLNCIC